MKWPKVMGLPVKNKQEVEKLWKERNRKKKPEQKVNWKDVKINKAI